MYDKIFHKELLKEEDVLASACLYQISENVFNNFTYLVSSTYRIYIIALFKIVFSDYIQTKKLKVYSSSKYIIEYYKNKNKIEIVNKTLIFIYENLLDFLEIDDFDEIEEVFERFDLPNYKEVSNHFTRIKDLVEKIEAVNLIQNQAVDDFNEPSF